jgi:hypothetical protein
MTGLLDLANTFMNDFATEEGEPMDLGRKRSYYLGVVVDHLC